MIKVNISDLQLCQKSLDNIQDSLQAALESKNPEALVDALLLAEPHFALCAKKGAFDGINIAKQVIYKGLNHQKKITWDIIDQSGISAEMISLIAQTIGLNLTQALLRSASSYESHYPISMAVDTALYRVALQESILQAKSDRYYSVRLSGRNSDSNHQCIVEAIEFYSQFDDGHVHLAHADLWRALRNFKPARNTKQNYLKLPDNVKRALKKHEALAISSYQYVRKHQDHAACTLSVVRELFEFDLKELAQLLLKDCLKIIESPDATDGIQYSLPRTNDRSYRVMSLMQQMGYPNRAEAFSAAWLSKPTRGDHEDLYSKMSALAYFIENEGTSEEVFAKQMSCVFTDFEKDEPDRTLPSLANLLFEMKRNIPTKNTAAWAKIDILNGHIGHLYGEYPKGAAEAAKELLEKNGTDIIKELKQSNGYRRGSLINDLGM